MANQFIIDLRKNSKRGMEGKADRGWLPSRVPLGYLNDKLEHQWCEWFVPIKNNYSAIEVDYKRLELNENGSVNEKNVAFADIFSRWGG